MEAYKAAVEERLRQLSWAKQLEVQVGSVKAANPPKQMPEMPKSLEKVGSRGFDGWGLGGVWSFEVGRDGFWMFLACFDLMKPF